jgi:hypothetical protein
MGVLCCLRIFFPDLDGLVSLTGDETAARKIEGRGEDTSLSIERA